MLIGFRIFALGLHRTPDNFEVNIYGRNHPLACRKWTDESSIESLHRLFHLLIQTKRSAD